MAKTKKTYSSTSYERLPHRIFDDVVDVASTLFRSRKEAGAETLHSLAEATRAYAEAMTDLPTLQNQVSIASDNISHFADYVMHTDVHHMVNDATVVAKRRPLLAIGVAAAGGLALTRFLTTRQQPKQTSPRKRRSKAASKTVATAKRSTNGSAHANE